MKLRLGKIRFTKKLVGIILLIGVVFIGVWYVRETSTRRSNNTAKSNPLIAQTNINSEYKFNALTSNQKKTDIVLRITDAEIRKEVLIQGKPANASGDKAFLILNLEFDNSDTTNKYIAPVNLFRLIDEQGKKYAADIHSNIVEVAPISTKKTKIGFVINESQKKFMLNLGELDGDKTELEINF